jgi:hypothetical protein
MLFPSRHALLEDFPDGVDVFPNTTNAQESMHCLYYMLRYILMLLGYIAYERQLANNHGTALGKSLCS